MKNKIILILGVITLIFGISLYISIFKMIENKKTAVRWENNYKESNKNVSLIKMTLKEFKEQATTKEDSLLKELNIKPKEVERIVYIENKIEMKDTVKLTIVDTVYDLQSFSKIYTFEEKSNCISIEGYSISKYEPEIYLTHVESNSEVSYVAYKQRRKRKLLFFNTRLFGKKETKLEVKSSCGELKVLEIDIINKK